MERQHESDPTPAPGRKKIYESPEIYEWGTITDLTQGLKLGGHDVPVKGGTRLT
jgi:hypothetical protein